nr:MAG TPA: hypothetical protein [Caudoviricetes sp.]
MPLLNIQLAGVRGSNVLVHLSKRLNCISSDLT